MSICALKVAFSRFQFTFHTQRQDQSKSYVPREMTLYAQNLISVMHGIVEFWTNLYGHDCIEFSMHT